MFNPEYTTKNKKDNRIPIYSGKKRIGFVAGETFIKQVFGPKHFLRQPPAIAFDADSLDAAEKAGARLVQVIDQEDKATYTASIATIRASGFKFNRGFGSQIGLTFNLWSRSKPGDPKQPGLFDNIREK